MSVQSLPAPSNTVLRGYAMLKIDYPICCGMDVHKSFLVACIASTNEDGVTSYKSKRFSSFPGDLRHCAAWLADIFKHDLVSGSFIPPADIRQLRDPVRCRWRLPTSPLARKTARRTASPFPTSNWTMCSPMFLSRPLLLLQLAFCRTHLCLLSMYLHFAPKA